jgi:DNA polymerase-3 subunit chi
VTVTFYILLAQQDEKAKDRTLIKLMEKMMERHERVLILTETRERAIFLDQLLWTYTPLSFLPHGLEGDDSSEDQPLWITSTPNNANKAGVLVLDGIVPNPTVLPFWNSFGRIVSFIKAFEIELYRPVFEHLAADPRYALSCWQQSATSWVPKDRL